MNTAHGTRHTALSACSLLRSALLIGICTTSIGSFAQSLTVTLATSNYNGYHVSCFGKKNGSIDATVTGGTPPYTYDWSNGSTTPDITGLASGYYNLKVVDAIGGSVEVDKTLIEPEALKLTLEPFKYPNGYHISCNECFNGSIDLGVSGGVGPFTYLWADGASTQDRTGLGAFTHYVAVTDANMCVTESEKLLLSQPERMDWTMEGNANTVPGSHFFGTTDAKDVVFKSNGVEALRLTTLGDLKLSAMAMESPQFVYLDTEGTLKKGPFPDGWQMTEVPWYLGGNTEVGPLVNRLGTVNAMDLIMITNDTERMRIDQRGKVGIGVDPSGDVDGYRLYVEDGIATRDVLVKLGDWPDYVFKEGYRLMPLSELRTFLATEGHLPGIPSAQEVDEQGGFEVGDMQKRMMETIEQQTLYILQLQEQLDRLEQQVKAAPKYQH